MDLNERFVSIVVPVYNGEPYIEKCINSLLRQTYTDIEIIVVNDGSTDNTSDLCHKYEDECNNIHIIEKKNEGVSIARLYGVRAAQGDYISFVDADDFLDTDFIENMMLEMSDADIILAGISRMFVNEDNRVCEERNNICAGIYEGKKLVSLYSKMLCLDMPFKAGILPYMCNKIYRKNILLPLLESLDKCIFDGEDVAVIFPYLLLSKKIVLSDYCGYQYLIHENSACMKKSDKAYYNASRLYIWLYDNFVMSDYADILMPQLNNYYIRMIWKRDPALFLEANDFIFPYSRVGCGARIILYGAGEMGNVYYRQINKSNYCTIVAWADKNIRYLEKWGVALITPEEIAGLEYDYVVVAIRSKFIYNIVFDYLVEIGVKSEKIILFDK